MRTTVEPLEGNKVKVSVEIDEPEFDRAIDAAFRRISREVKVPGFRPGKAPRRLLEARLGSDVARDEALRESLPDYYAEAVKEHHLDAIAPPEIDITAGKEGGPVAFDAVVEVRPQVDITSYESLQVRIPRPEPTEAEIDARIDRLREQFGELHTVTRPARDGDHVSIDLRGYRHSEAIEGLTADDFLYEVGSGSIVAKLDDELRGARAGDILRFNAERAEGDESTHDEITYQVLVKEVREKVLPEVNDEWASEASEFETVQELRDSIRGTVASLKRVQAALAARDGVIDALVQLVDEAPPDRLVQEETERRLRDMSRRLAEQGADIPRYLQARGLSEEQLLENLREAAVHGVKADLALRGVADAEGIEATDEEVEAEVLQMAEQAGVPAREARRRLDRADQLAAVRSDIRKSKALAWLVEHSEFVDEDGQPVDRSQLLPAPAGDGSAQGGQPVKESE